MSRASQQAHHIQPLQEDPLAFDLTRGSLVAGLEFTEPPLSAVSVLVGRSLVEPLSKKGPEVDWD